MQCTKCGMKMRCIDTRTTKRGRRRWYKCPKCSHRVNTIEILREEFEKMRTWYNDNDGTIDFIEKLMVLFEEYKSGNLKRGWKSFFAGGEQDAKQID